MSDDTHTSRVGRRCTPAYILKIRSVLTLIVPTAPFSVFPATVASNSRLLKGMPAVLLDFYQIVPEHRYAIDYKTVVGCPRIIEDSIWAKYGSRAIK
jgi:hypothetical protein